MNIFPSIFVSERSSGPLLETTMFHDTKDPCPVFDGTGWHMYGSGGQSGAEIWKILHATAPTLRGPWKEAGIAQLEDVTGDHVAAPGVVRDSHEELFHMFVQEEFMGLGGRVAHLTSKDSVHFKLFNISLESVPGTGEAGIYDPHPAEINGEKYIVYSGSDTFHFTGTRYIGMPDIYVAKSKSGSWYGPWERMGCILRHEDVAQHHNQKVDPDYEWGLEGPQLLQLPNGTILLSAVCFLPGIAFGRRQRVFFAIAHSIMGPYHSLGPIIHPTVDSWQNGEIGHATGMIQNDDLMLFYQARGEDTPWRYGVASIPLRNLL